jgi:hypothetical protein
VRCGNLPRPLEDQGRSADGRPLRFDYERGFINIEPAPARAAKAQ